MFFFLVSNSPRLVLSRLEVVEHTSSYRPEANSQGSVYVLSLILSCHKFEADGRKRFCRGVYSKSEAVRQRTSSCLYSAPALTEIHRSR